MYNEILLFYLNNEINIFIIYYLYYYSVILFLITLFLVIRFKFINFIIFKYFTDYLQTFNFFLLKGDIVIELLN